MKMGTKLSLVVVKGVPYAGRHQPNKQISEGEIIVVQRIKH